MTDKAPRRTPQRTERLSKVFVTEQTRHEMAAMLAEKGKTIGPGNVAGLVLEEARVLGLLRIIWEVQEARFSGASDSECRAVLERALLARSSAIPVTHR